MPNYRDTFKIEKSNKQNQKENKNKKTIVSKIPGQSKMCRNLYKNTTLDTDLPFESK